MGGMKRKPAGMTPENFFMSFGFSLNREVIASRFEMESGAAFLEIRETARLRELKRCPQRGGGAFYYDF